jgi:hypothetical protein
MNHNIKNSLIFVHYTEKYEPNNQFIRLIKTKKSE